MCGICGEVWRDPARPPDLDAIRAMNAAMVHRGPDDEGVWTGRGAAIGARRLSIVDVAHGAQPMATEEGRHAVAFNGEVYNAAELRVELQAAGVVFRTACDTEVVLHAHAAWGDDATHRFNGMFAYAIWDDAERRLLLVRDRLGIKPLYVAERDDGVAFASELSALQAAGRTNGAIDPRALDLYFAYGYVPSPMTIYKDVTKLEPGERLIWHDGVVRRERYWEPRGEVDTSWTLASAAERLQALLDDAVQLRRVGERPLGAFLSGGVDSSSVVASLATQSSAPVKTFTIGFDDDRYDERRYARLVSERYGTEHTDLEMEIGAAADIDELLPHFGEPFADSSAIPTWAVSKLAAAQVTVALSGDGGDELFAGYTWHAMQRRVEAARRVPAILRRFLRAGIGAGRVGRFLDDTFAEPWEGYRRRHTTFDDGERAALLGKSEPDAQKAFERHIDESVSFDEAMLRHDLRMYLPDDILTKVDRMSMASSLEARVPLLDYRLVEFAMTLPFDLKYAQAQSKRVLKHAMRDRLPAEILAPRKQGFSVPIHRWFREELGDRFRDEALGRESRIAAHVDIGAARGYLDGHQTGREEWGHRLWALWILERWLRR